MTHLKYFILATAFGLSLGAAVSRETQTVATKMGAVSVEEVKFSKGSANLNDSEKRALDQLVKNANKQKVKEVRVLAWADREYPKQDEKVSDSQVNLANERGRAIKDYLHEKFSATFETYNMAERPNKLEQVLNTSDHDVKATMEKTGAAPTSQDATGLFGLKGKATHALVFVIPDKE